MLKNKLAIFIAKRVLICFIILSIIDVVLMGNRWYILAGLLAGGIFSVLKFGSYAAVFERIVSPTSSQAQKRLKAVSCILVFTLNQIVLFPLLYLAYIYNHWFFTGSLAGILLVPFVIMINCVTEATGITRNNFE